MKAILSFALLCLLTTSAFAQISGLRELMPPPKVAYLTKDDTSRVYLPTGVIGMCSIDPTTDRISAFNRMQKLLLRAFSAQYGASSIAFKKYPSEVPANNRFIVGVLGDNEAFDSLVQAHLTPGEKLDQSEGYLVHAAENFILIAGFDTAGLVHAATRFTELWAGGNKYLPAHILDYPDYPNRWAFSMHNLRGTNAVNVLKNILDTMQRYHYNGMQQNDFKYSILEQQPSWYFTNADTIITHAHDRSIEMIPGVAPYGYSEGILWHDPNLAEGFPANGKYIIESDTARLIPDPPVEIANGGFENVNGNGAFTGFGFYDNENGATTADMAIKHSGSQSARVIDPAKANGSGNARFSLPITTKPNKHYYLSAWVRTENVDRGEFRVLAIGAEEGKTALSLTHTAFNVPSTTDRAKNDGWIKLGVLFSTQHYSKMNIYCGIWGGNKGTIWWDDFKIEEAGFMNILRRDGTPLSVTTSSGQDLNEGQDFAPLHDSIMLKQGVLYDFHKAPTLKRLPSGSLANGDTINASFYHAFTTIQDVNGYGQNMACPSEPAVTQIVQDQITRVRDLHKTPRKYMMGHDEIRHLNWDHSCQSRSLTPAEILGANASLTSGQIKALSVDNEVYAWSDMFDSLHNAHDDFYAVNGDLAGVWNMIPKDITIVNWNSGNRDKSLAFFARHGFAQMSAPYYDAGNTVNMREWRLSQQNVPNIKGMMYTTWSSDYSHLRPFSYYAWGAGPYIMHKPIDSLSAATTSSITAEVTADPFDGTDGIVSVKAIYTPRSGTMDSVTLAPGAKNKYSAALSNPISSYKLVALNKQGLVRQTPTYTYASGGNASVGLEALDNRQAIYPNPTSDVLVAQEGAIIRVLSLSGAEVLLAEKGERTLNVSSLAAGAYLAEIKSNDGSFRTVKFVKQ